MMRNWCVCFFITRKSKMGRWWSVGHVAVSDHSIDRYDDEEAGKNLCFIELCNNKQAIHGKWLSFHYFIDYLEIMDELSYLCKSDGVGKMARAESTHPHAPFSHTRLMTRTGVFWCGSCSLDVSRDCIVNLLPWRFGAYQIYDASQSL